ncbi:MAG: DUF427 domain-containing protein [Candidatus Promineifilaceae bacterium]|nr:DUF427 domain-containing protein [Candidatus Promineifilaceae bacterium]
MKATWKDAVLAESDETVIVEGNHYFPPHAVNHRYFRESDTHTRCYWKGVASYYDIVVAEAVNKNAAWTYPEPKRDAEHMRDYVAFWHGVQVQES